ncbi:hypothetical protein GO485_25960 [Pseudoduganella flava]|uniref:Toxin co-regulated pilus biosynthesis protein Q C-terminal domain-containing protein n=1 Tax=Pseudoduganella flava TaxID=871742 RepID=A0ABX6G0N9_9BURK|nr:hypothetical protein GO485_25960 [Pseudoduganella flava]
MIGCVALPAQALAAPVAGPVAQESAPAAAEKPAAKPAPKRINRPKKRDNGTVTAAQEAKSTEPAPLPAPGALQQPAAGGDTWEIALTDRTLNAALARWAAAAGWQLLWELPVDYAVQARTTIPGKFEDAVALVVTSMEGAEIPMKAVFYQGNKVLRIMAKGAQ